MARSYIDTACIFKITLIKMTSTPRTQLQDRRMDELSDCSAASS